MSYEQYEHHGKTVWVDSALKGKHRDHCLCFSCDKLQLGTKNKCQIADALFALCVKHSIVTPVFECPAFQLKKPESHAP